MINLYGDYFVGSDGVRNIILYKKTVVTGEGKKGAKAKAENIGKPKYEPVGYYTTVQNMLEGLSQNLMFSVLADPKVKELKDAVDKVNAIVESLSFTLKVNGEEKPITAKMIPKCEAQ